MTALAIACGTGDREQSPEEIGQRSSALTDDERIGMDQISSNPSNSDWTASNGTLSQSPMHTQGAFSLAIANIGFVQLNSLPLTALQPGPSGSMDIRIPGAGIASQNIFNQPLAAVSLQNRPQGNFQELTLACLRMLTRKGGVWQ